MSISQENSVREGEGVPHDSSKDESKTERRRMQQTQKESRVVVFGCMVLTSVECTLHLAGVPPAEPSPSATAVQRVACASWRNRHCTGHGHKRRVARLFLQQGHVSRSQHAEAITKHGWLYTRSVVAYGMWTYQQASSFCSIFT